jgi:probable F420-dependent oxidoreductase
MKMPRVAIGVYGLQRWFDGDFAGVIDIVRRSDEKGVDQVSITDHVVMGEHLENYPYGPFRDPLTCPWYEPITVLGALAGATKTIRLSMGILIAPLRPAVLLAKQLATLDVMSRGRVDAGLGLGWQKEEYDAAGVPWEGRYARMEEQVKVCKALWSEAPAAFHGKTVDFEKIHAYPRPVQDPLPIWFGLAPTEKNFARIAALGDGWIPMENDAEKLAPMVDNLRAAFRAAGRDPAKIDVRVVAPYVFRADYTCDLDATLAKVPALVEAGATVVEFHPLYLCSGPDDLDRFLDAILVLKAAR